MSTGSEDPSENFLLCDVTANEERIICLQYLCIKVLHPREKGEYPYQVHHETIFPCKNMTVGRRDLGKPVVEVLVSA